MLGMPLYPTASNLYLSSDQFSSRLKYYWFTIHFNNIIPSTIRSRKESSPFTLSYETISDISNVPQNIRKAIYLSLVMTAT